MTALYSGPIIDAHHHLWDLRLKRHPWLAAGLPPRGGFDDLEPIRKNYLPADYRRDAARQNVVASVHVEAAWEERYCIEETAWLDTLDRSGGIALRLVAHVPLASPEAQALIEAQAAFSRVVGIRDIVSFHDDPARSFASRGDLMRDNAWRDGLSHLAHYDLAFDLMLLPQQLADAADLADAFPNQQFLLNHAGSPADRDTEGLRRWRDGVADLAKRPNVAIKISALVAYDRQWTQASLRPVVLHCLDCFGSDRALFASDFPVAGLYASFDDIFDTFKAIVADLTAEEQERLFFRNAARFYRCGLEFSSPPRLAS